jgi:hypothetical protein
MSPYIAASTTLPKSGVSAGVSIRVSAETTFIRRPLSQRLSLLQIFCTQLSKVETLNVLSLNFQPYDDFRIELQRMLQTVWRLSRNYSIIIPACICRSEGVSVRGCLRACVRACVRDFHLRISMKFVVRVVLFEIVLSRFNQNGQYTTFIFVK